jgi:hypothetical protein
MSNEFRGFDLEAAAEIENIPDYGFGGFLGEPLNEPACGQARAVPPGFVCTR